MQKNTIVKISSNLQCQKYLKGNPQKSKTSLFKPKMLMKVKRVHFDQTKISGKMSHSDEKTLCLLHNYRENFHQFHRTKKKQWGHP